MSDVVSLNDRRQEKSPHLSGKCRCAACGHVWQAVAPIGTMNLECPECLTMRGLWMHPFGPADGNLIYSCTLCDSTCMTAWRTKASPEVRIMCVGCGSPQSVDSMFPL